MRPDHSPPAENVPETRLYGVNACLAAFAHRPDALRKVYLVESRMSALRDVLAWCVKHRLGYRIVEETDLDKLTSSRHHEGVCFDVRRSPPLALDELLTDEAKRGSSVLLWLDGVGNPHNLGALLRSAAHFGVSGVVVSGDSPIDVSGAAARVAEGAAEVVPLVHAASDDARTRLSAAGYAIVATVPRDGVSLYASELPTRLVFIIGAEGEGMSDAMIDGADIRLTIPGSGAIESLNVAASVAVLLGEYARRHGVSTYDGVKPARANVRTTAAMSPPERRDDRHRAVPPRAVSRRDVPQNDARTPRPAPSRPSSQADRPVRRDDRSPRREERTAPGDDRALSRTDQAASSPRDDASPWNNAAEARHRRPPRR